LVTFRRFLGPIAPLAVALALVPSGCGQISGLGGYSTGEAPDTEAGVTVAPDGNPGEPPPTDATVADEAPEPGDSEAAGDDAPGASDDAPGEGGGEAGPAEAGPVSADGGCNGSQTACAGDCVTLATDPDNCGTCGHMCTTTVANAQPACVSNGCNFACNTNYTLCGGKCADFSTDNGNCGGCGNSCAATCQGGACIVPFGYTPSNFTANTYANEVPKAGTTVNCNLTYTSPGTAGASTWCGGTGPYVVVNVAQSGGPNVDVLVFNSLTVQSGFTLSLRGTRPVILAVYGFVTIAGTVDASASGATPGAGGNNATYCGTAPQDSQDAQWGGGGGGGRAVAGGKGNQGNAATASFDTGGTASGNATASPLLGGCSGEIGGNLCNGVNCQQCLTAGNNCEPPGGGGGGVQISSSSTVSVTGTVAANGSAGTTGGTSQIGGGGGGSGGDILLEGTAVTVSGTLSVNGGAGGSGGTGGNVGGTAGSAGTSNGTTSVAPGNGTGGSGGNQGGGGGGGAYGFAVIGVR
jgi:hypothetical protein